MFCKNQCDLQWKHSLPKMEVLFRDFQTANTEMSGPLLAATIAPIAPPNYLNRLDAIYKDSNAASVSRNVAFGLTKSAHAAIQYPNPEIDTWTEIYSAYWYAIGGIIAAEQSTSRPDWQGVYMAWKDLANSVIKGYSSGVLEAWTLPVLYIAGKHLRIFATKADESAGGDAAFNSGVLQEDIAGDFGKNQKLEDAARVINRMFTLCISDRYVAVNQNILQKPIHHDPLLNRPFQSTTRRIPEMGPLLHHQPPVQNLLQAQLHRPLQKHPARPFSLEDGHARLRRLSAIPHRHLQVLRRSDPVPRGRLRYRRRESDLRLVYVPQIPYSQYGAHLDILDPNATLDETTSSLPTTSITLPTTNPTFHAPRRRYSQRFPLDVRRSSRRGGSRIR